MLRAMLLNDDIKRILQILPRCSACVRDFHKRRNEVRNKFNKRKAMGSRDRAPSSFLFQRASSKENCVKIYCSRLRVYCFKSINQSLSWEIFLAIKPSAQVALKRVQNLSYFNELEIQNMHIYQRLSHAMP